MNGNLKQFLIMYYYIGNIFNILINKITNIIKHKIKKKCTCINIDTIENEYYNTITIDELRIMINDILDNFIKYNELNLTKNALINIIDSKYTY
ncbi:hypothetical protein [Alphaentomopoxvirus acuprea]|uniref:Uncharacterized protein n=1 Tax=Alphaentomopoxvirus acuprea TaxID=62099 RepID=W6JIX0_9POXV|nr:hypothetical protein BA82_gp188 [Anomala cuprea entomopoxvirus]BAO49548.1 hypothetical protein [Anomala cuprea entomopoxvirus]